MGGPADLCLFSSIANVVYVYGFCWASFISLTGSPCYLKLTKTWQRADYATVAKSRSTWDLQCSYQRALAWRLVKSFVPVACGGSFLYSRNSGGPCNIVLYILWHVVSISYFWQSVHRWAKHSFQFCILASQCWVKHSATIDGLSTVLPTLVHILAQMRKQQG